MEIKILKDEKNELEAEIEDTTLVEILRIYLNKDSDVTFAAWKRAHLTESPILKIETKGKAAKKALNDAISSATKDLESVESDFKKLK
jgi:DNA-directed RNA polymerase subunit L